jgi:hypothetical protein
MLLIIPRDVLNIILGMCDSITRNRLRLVCKLFNPRPRKEHYKYKMLSGEIIVNGPEPYPILIYNEGIFLNFKYNKIFIHKGINLAYYYSTDSDIDVLVAKHYIDIDEVFIVGSRTYRYKMYHRLGYNVMKVDLPIDIYDRDNIRIHSEILRLKRN